MFFRSRTIPAIHVSLDFFEILFDVIQNPVFNRPFEEIQLSDGGFHVLVFATRNRNTVPATERVEPLFRVGFQLQLVLVVHFEFNGFGDISHDTCFGLYGIPRVVFFRVIGDEPIHDAERHARIAFDNLHQFRHVFFGFIERQEIPEKQIVLGIGGCIIRHLIRGGWGGL